MRYFACFFISFLASIQLIVSITEKLNKSKNKIVIIRKVFLISFVSSTILHISFNFLEIGNIQHFIFFGIILLTLLIVNKMEIITEFLSYQNSFSIVIIQCVSVIILFTVIVFNIGGNEIITWMDKPIKMIALNQIILIDILITLLTLIRYSNSSDSKAAIFAIIGFFTFMFTNMFLVFKINPSDLASVSVYTVLILFSLSNKHNWY